MAKFVFRGKDCGLTNTSLEETLIVSDFKTFYKTVSENSGYNYYFHGFEIDEKTGRIIVTQSTGFTQIGYVETNFPVRKSYDVKMIRIMLYPDQVVMKDYQTAGAINADIILCLSHGLIILVRIFVIANRQIPKKHEKFLDASNFIDKTILKYLAIHQCKNFPAYGIETIFAKQPTEKIFSKLFINGKLAPEKFELPKNFSVGSNGKNLYIEETYHLPSQMIFRDVENYNPKFHVSVEWKKIYIGRKNDLFLVTRPKKIACNSPDIAVFLPGNRIVFYKMIKTKHINEHYSPNSEFEVEVWAREKMGIKITRPY